MLTARNIQGVLPACLALCAAFALFVPARWQTWTSPFSMATSLAVAPLSGPVSRIASWAKPGSTKPRPEELLALENKVEDLSRDNLALSQENAHFRELLAQLRVMPPAARGDVDRVPATVVASSSDAAGGSVAASVSGLNSSAAGAVVTVAFTQLFGRVTKVEKPLCWITPITARESPDIDADVIVPGVGVGVGADAIASVTLRARLSPTGTGLLKGDVEDKRDATTNAVIEPRTGMEVRVNDPSRWPSHAQALRIGVVERVERSTKHPLRKVIVVRPAPADLRDARELIVALPRQAPITGATTFSGVEESTQGNNAGGPR